MNPPPTAKADASLARAYRRRDPRPVRWIGAAGPAVLVLLCLAGVGVGVPPGRAENPAADEKAASGLPPADLLRGLRSARIAHMRGEHEQELAMLTATHELYPDDLSAIEARLHYHRNHEGPPEKVRELRTLLADRLASPSAAWPIATLIPLAHLSSDDPAVMRAIADHLLRRADQLRTEDEELLGLLGELSGRLGDEDLHVRVLERLEQLAPAFAIRWQLVRLYRVQGRHEEAATLLERWLGDEDPPGIVRSTYISVLSRLGRLAELEAQLELRAAELGLTNGQIASLGAEPTILRGDPTSTSATPDPGPALVISGSVSGSEPDSRMVSRLRFVYEIESSAWLLRDAGRDEAAERLFRWALAIAPENPRLRSIVTHLYGSPEELRALAEVEDLRWTRESDPQDLFAEGTKRLTAGDSASALELLRRAAPGLPRLEAAWYNLGMAAYREEAWETVVEAFGKAAELAPERAQTFFFRGLALEKLDRCAEAVPDLDRAVTLDPSRAIAHYYLADCYARLGEAAKSAHHRQLYDARR
ncbi:MAG: tetratricopeptide repeat protein [Holophagales bacterium]|nr:tetratricopeptide repeat protein [Holophagales bacterium]